MNIITGTLALIAILLAVAITAGSIIVRDQRTKLRQLDELHTTLYNTHRDTCKAWNADLAELREIDRVLERIFRRPWQDTAYASRVEAIRDLRRKGRVRMPEWETTDEAKALAEVVDTMGTPVGADDATASLLD